MEIQLIRNATMRIAYGGRLFLTDPFLGARHTLRSFAGISPNPLADLPCPVQEVLRDIEMVVISHLHSDHFDEAAEADIAKHTPLFCQPGDDEQLMSKGFQQVTAVDDSVTWRGITLRRTQGQHGMGEWAERMGKVSGFVFMADGEPTMYWAGDTIWYEGVESVIQDTAPDVIITHSSGARFGDGPAIVMDAEQTIALCQAAPEAVVIAIHMETLDHGTVSRADLRALAKANGISRGQLRIPADGETLDFKLE